MLSGFDLSEPKISRRISAELPESLSDKTGGRGVGGRAAGEEVERRRPRATSRSHALFRCELRPLKGSRAGELQGLIYI